MARLFFTLYTGILASTLVFSIMFELVVSAFLYDVDTNDQRQLVEGHVALFDRIHQLGGEQAMLMAMQQVAQTNYLLLTPVTDPLLLAEPELRQLPASGVLLDSLAEDEEAYFFRLASNDQLYQVAPDYASEHWQQLEFQDALYLWGLLASNALIALGWLWFLHRKLRLVERSALRIAGGDFSARVPENDSQKIGAINVAFNQMADRVEHLIASHKRLTNAVAHELRTPIFRLRCQLALLEPPVPVIKEGSGACEVQDEEWDNSVQGMEDDLTELEAMVDELLSYARMERAGLPLQQQTLELNQWLAGLRQKLERSCQHSLALEIGETLHSHIDPHLIQRALSNLIRNADRYAQQRIEIQLFAQDSWVVVCVDDDGCGIPEADRQRVLEPFERLDTARDRQSGGHGLGLSIVREIMARHDGRVLISRAPLGGARIALYLPRAQ